jgi:hypothetical protein
MLFWLLSYIESPAMYDAFYIWSFVNTWYLVTLFWIPMLFFMVHLIVRYTISDDDHATTVFIINLLAGVTTLVMQLVWADRFNLWYVKRQFLAGRSVNKAKSMVWSWPAALGTTARTIFNNYDEEVAAEEEAAAPKA